MGLRGSYTWKKGKNPTKVVSQKVAISGGVTVGGLREALEDLDMF